MKKVLTSFLLVLLIFDVFIGNISRADIIEDITDQTTTVEGETEQTEDDQAFENSLSYQNNDGEGINIGATLLDGIARNNKLCLENTSSSNSRNNEWTSYSCCSNGWSKRDRRNCYTR